MKEQAMKMFQKLSVLDYRLLKLAVACSRSRIPGSQVLKRACLKTISVSLSLQNRLMMFYVRNKA
jgi:hypothetical protein